MPIDISWRRIDGSATEQAIVFEEQTGLRLEGTIHSAIENQSMNTQYRIETDRGWGTRSVWIKVEQDQEKRELSLVVDLLLRWWDGDEEIGVLAGCEFVDLQISPLTNTFPLRRENIPVGDSRLVTAAWIRFPDLALQPVRQRYTRLSEDTYHFEDLDSGYSAELWVDSRGFVIRYDEIWERS